jgi:RimJ/RimL family protein N-acetyltransferase
MNLTFKSDRLVFRPLSETDLDLAIEQWTDPDVVKYVADKTYTEEELAEEMPIFTTAVESGA